LINLTERLRCNGHTVVLHSEDKMQKGGKERAIGCINDCPNVGGQVGLVGLVVVVVVKVIVVVTTPPIGYVGCMLTVTAKRVGYAGVRAWLVI